MARVRGGSHHQGTIQVVPDVVWEVGFVIHIVRAASVRWVCSEGVDCSLDREE